MGCETSSRSVRKPRVEKKSYIIVVHMLKVESIKGLLLQSMFLQTLQIVGWEIELPTMSPAN